MWKALLSLNIWAKIKFWFLIVIGVVTSSIAYLEVKRKRDVDAYKDKKAAEDQLKREKAREAAFKEKRDVDGISDSDLVDRLRRRSDDWGGL